MSAPATTEHASGVELSPRASLLVFAALMAVVLAVAAPSLLRRRAAAP